MANDSNFPTTLDAVPTDRTSGGPVPSVDWNKYFDATYKLEEKVGIDSSVDTTTLDYKLKNASSLNPGHKHNNAGLSNVPYSATIDTVTISASTITTSAHGLGAAPTKIQVSVVCITAEQGWSVGDEIYTFSNYYDGTNNRRLFVGADATNIIIITSTALIALVHKTTGTAVVPTYNYWKFRIRAGI